MTNIIRSILNIVNNKKKKTNYTIKKSNRVSDEGKKFEIYIKDSFAGSFKKKNKKKHWENVFSYLGSVNNPPDIMIKRGDAIEIKKIKSDNSDLHLNSSSPKSKLLAKDKRIKEECRNCEKWSEKDLIYIIGTINNKETLTSINMIYGNCMFAENSYYENKEREIVEIIKKSELNLSETKELGRINKIDPLGISSLRVRGMWIFQNPKKIFEYLDLPKQKKKFELICLMKLDKFESMPENDKKNLINSKIDNLQVKDIKLKDPNNLENEIDCKLIMYRD